MTDIIDLEYELALTPPAERLAKLVELQAAFPEHHRALVDFYVELLIDEARNPIPDEP